MSVPKRLYLFDFDGTLTNKDTLFDFLKFYAHNRQGSSIPYWLTWMRFLPLFVLSKLNMFSKSKTKEVFIGAFLRGKSIMEIEETTKQYFIKRHQTLLRPLALAYLNQIADEPNKYIVTASMDIWTKPFADHFGLRLIATRALFKDDIYTGKFDGKNCNHEEKVARIKKEITLESFQDILVFGDSSGDAKMLELANHKHYRFFE